MKTVTCRRLFALLGYVSFFATAAPALAQLGPIQPVLVDGPGKTETAHSRPDLLDDYTVPIEVYVGADGSVANAVVSKSSGDPMVDGIAAAFMLDRKFLPALNAEGKAVDSMVNVNVNLYKRANKKMVRVAVKPPTLVEVNQRVHKLKCSDFVWEVSRMKSDAGIRDVSDEVMPYLSAFIYMQQKEVPGAVEEKFWDQWPSTLRKVVERCEKAPTKLYFTEVLVPALDGVLPTRETETAAAH